jgi:hypothetical protein
MQLYTKAFVSPIGETTLKPAGCGNRIKEEAQQLVIAREKLRCLVSLQVPSCQASSSTPTLSKSVINVAKEEAQ